MRRLSAVITLGLLWLDTGAYAHEEELYRAWRDPVNTRELSLQSVGMVVVLLGIVIWRRWVGRRQ
ncbi:MAG: hypothetical protein ACYC1M_13530 [Armatimonadota bacterium]